MYIYIYIYTYVCTHIWIVNICIYIYIYNHHHNNNNNHCNNNSCLHFSICARHPCAGAILILSVSFQCFPIVISLQLSYKEYLLSEGNPLQVGDLGLVVALVANVPFGCCSFYASLIDCYLVHALLVVVYCGLSLSPMYLPTSRWLIFRSAQVRAYDDRAWS